MAESVEERFEMWARVDLFGHNQRCGKLSVVNTGVEVLYRLDTPNKEGGNVTEYFGKGAVYSIMPMSEEAARLVASRLGPPAPISQWDLPEEWRNAMSAYKQLSAPAVAPATGPDVDEYGVDPEDEMADDEEMDDEPDLPF